MKRNLSGENILVTPFFTVKSGSPLVAEQGRVMLEIGDYQPLNVPRIYWLGKSSYVMETIKQSLGPPIYREWHWRIAEASMKNYWFIPEKWIHKNAPIYSARKTFEYIESQGWLNEITLPSLPFLQLYYENIPACLTHGDLTHENTVIERTKIYKFIDWQAKRHDYIPPHKDVDYGKLLQSLIGWDKNSPQQRTKFHAAHVRAIMKECHMAPFWCAVHFMRIKVRAKEDWQKEICDDNIDYCSWLYEKKDELL